MRDSTASSSTPYRSSRPSSPPADSVWSTERRLDEKPPPGAPRKSRRSSLPSKIDYQRSQPERLLLPSNTIDEDGEDGFILSYRPSRLFDDGFMAAEAQQQDPTTVLLVPNQPLPSMEETDDDDTVMSPRLFRFGNGSLSRFEAIAIDEDDESDEIFRRKEQEEGREGVHPRRLSWAVTMRSADTDDRL